ncbi:type II secretion system F family protein [Jejubacter sp. L23]|jgi:tight adherence protein C|uniref:type II secretion system F family protein n=1 Tax=Jejubacter sp. L23 TaxID=3092086 RepID=UPI003D729EDF
MIYILSLLLVLGLAGVGYQMLQQVRRDTVRKRLELNVSRSVNTRIIDPTERLMKKNSKMVQFSDLLDKNIIAKFITIVLMSYAIYYIDKSGLYAMGGDVLMLAILAVVALVIILPDQIKRNVIKRRVKSICRDLPFIIDVMAVCVQSGMTVENSLRYISENTSDINPDIATMLERVMLKSEVSGINAALEQLYEEVPASEVGMLCTTLQQSIKHGSSIYLVLNDLSKEMRAIQLLAVEEKVASLSAKMTLPMIGFIMLPLLLIIAGPGLIGMASLWGK